MMNSGDSVDDGTSTADVRGDRAPGFTWRKLAGFCAVLAMLLGGAWLFYGLDAGAGAISGEGIAAYVKSLGVWGHFGIIGLMIVHSFVPFPAEFVTIAAGMCFGAAWGGLLAWIGAMAGGLLAFALSRKFGRPFVADVLAPRKMAQIDNWSKATGITALLTMRLIPVIAFNLVNYAAGLTRVTWWRFTWTMALGILPMTALMAVMGDQMREPTPADWLMLIAASLVVVAVTFVARRYGLGRGRNS